MKRGFFCILILILCVSLCACGGVSAGGQKVEQNNGNQTESGVNNITWKSLNFSCYDMFGGGMVSDYFTTNSDGTVESSFGTSGTWQLEGNILTVTYPAISHAYELKTYGDTQFLLTAGFIYSAKPVSQLLTTSIEITLDNYKDYFEIKTYSTEITHKDQFGDVTGTETRTVTMLVLKEQYACRLIGDKSEFLFRYQDDLGFEQDMGAKIHSCDGVNYPLFGAGIKDVSSDISQFPMVKVKGTLMLVD